MQSVIIIVHLMLVLALIGVVLLQKSEGGGLVSTTTGFLSSRGTANVLSRTTALLAAGFFVTSLVLSWLAGFERKPSSIINTGGAPTTQQAPAGPGGPAPPISQSGRGVLDQLRGNVPAGGSAPGGSAPGGSAPSPAPGGPPAPPQSQ
jgi:preprotein translocase subunit SecG